MDFRIKKIITFFTTISLLFLSLLNISCSPANVLATGGSTAMVVAEGDRSFGSVVDDATIKVNIAAKFLNAGSNMFVEIPRIVNSIDLNTTLQTLLEEAFDNEGRLSGTTFTELGLLRAKVRTLKADILQTLDNIVQLPSIKSKLALESGGPLYSEVASSRDDSSGGRLVLPIDPKYASDVGIVHDSSRSGKTVYVEPSEIVGPTNELRQIERELEA